MPFCSILLRAQAYHIYYYELGAETSRTQELVESLIAAGGAIPDMSQMQRPSTVSQKPINEDADGMDDSAKEEPGSNVLTVEGTP